MSQLIAWVLLGLGLTLGDSLQAVERLVAESETGVVYGDLDCDIFYYDVDVNSVRFESDPFLYLHGSLAVDARCADRDGIIRRVSGRDRMWFPTLRFDRLSQSWRSGNIEVAYRRPGNRVELSPNIDIRKWDFADETHIAFRIELWYVCKSDGPSCPEYEGQ